MKHHQSYDYIIAGAENYCEVSHTCVDAVQQAAAFFNFDFNAKTQAGVGRIDANVHNCQRQSTAATYLKLRPNNLTILTGSRVLRAELSGNKASGVQINYKDNLRSLCATRGIISCLWASESPKLLMLSGIGKQRLKTGKPASENNLFPPFITVEFRLVVLPFLMHIKLLKTNIDPQFNSIYQNFIKSVLGSP